MWARFCQMKMAGHRRLTVLLALLELLLLRVGAQQPEVKLVGSDVTMEPKYTGNPSEINWKINGNKLVDMEVTPPSDPIFYRFQGRASIVKSNGSLTIRNLTLGDSGLYKAEVLVNSVYQYTEVNLTVRACPLIPTISDQSTDDQIVLLCESSTPGVTYEWFYQTRSVGKSLSYYERRSKKDVTLTCVVDNKVCNKSSSITIRYIPEPSGLPVWIIALIVILVLILILGVIALLHHKRKQPCVKKIYSFLTCNNTSWAVNAFDTVYIIVTCCKGTNKIENDERKADVPLMSGGLKGAKGDVEEGNAPVKKVEGVKGANGDAEEGNSPDKKVKESDGCGRIALNLPCKGKMRLVKFQKDGGPSIEAEVGEVDGQPERIVRLSVTIEGVEPADYEDFAAEAHLSNGERRLFPMKGDECDVEEENAAAAVDKKGKDDVVIIECEGDRVGLTVPDTEKVTKLTWKKGDDILFTWEVSGLKLHANNVTLEPGSAIVNNLEPGDSGSYNVEVHSTDRSVTKSTFQVAVFEQVDKSENHRNVKLKVVRKVDLPENGHPENQPIGSITFHPIEMSKKTEITWKKGGQPVNIGGDRIKLGSNGDLTINKATQKDQGEYTVHCEDQELERFNLHL